MRHRGQGSPDSKYRMNYELRRQASGAMALYNSESRETMHPKKGPWQEANDLYVHGSGLRQLLQPSGGPGQEGPLVIFDVGLGGAANALAAIRCRDDLLRAKRRVRPLRIISFENDPTPLQFALENADRLAYPVGSEDAMEDILSHRKWSDGQGTEWMLRLGDFQELILEESERAEIVFFDPFSPRTNPAMWSRQVLEQVYQCRKPGGPLRLVTYSTAYGVRASMLLSGFFVGECLLPDGTMGGTEASLFFSDLNAPLSPRWLSRWSHDRQPWPPLSKSKDYPRLRKDLQEHPQWSQAIFLMERPEPTKRNNGPRPKRPPTSAKSATGSQGKKAPGKARPVKRPGKQGETKKAAFPKQRFAKGKKARKPKSR